MADPRLLPISAYGFAATFKLRELVQAFAELGPAQIEKDRLLVGVGGERFALAFDFGAVVFIGVEEEVQKRIIDHVLKCLPAEPNPPITETFLIEVDPTIGSEGAPAPHVRFDRVIVRKVTIPIVDVVAEMIAQSVAIDYYKKDVDDVEARFDRIVAQLQKAGRAPPVRELTTFIGVCIALRNDVVSTLALFDKPDDTWENEQLDRLWDGLRRLLEVDDRYRALEAKLRLFQDNLVVLVDLARQRHTYALEVAVAVLILFELIVMLWQIFGTHG